MKIDNRIFILLLVCILAGCSEPSEDTNQSQIVVDAGEDVIEDSGESQDSEDDEVTDADADIIDSDDADGVDDESDAEPDVDEGPEFVPYFHDDFEDYELGEKPLGGFGRTEVSAEQAYRGENSALIAIEEGDNGGFGKWGYSHSIEPEIEKGGEIWVRFYAYWPQSFEFSASPWMKFIRLHNADGQGENDGYNDLYIDHADETESVLRIIKEKHNSWKVYDGHPIPRDQWERYEMYLSVDDVTVDNGGGSRFRVWRDDELIFDRTDIPTLVTADGVIDLLYIFSYWNNEEPPSNHSYIDDIVIATDANPPPNVDADGNVYIGDW